MNVRKIHLLLPVLTLAILCFTCAHKEAPSGGPVDREPPTIISTFPAADSVGITQLEYIEITFSEAIDPTSLIDNFWLIPEPEEPLEIKWEGSNRVRFYFAAGLQADQTYTFNLGTGITDIRNNRMANPLQLAFSTGEKLNSAAVKGKVYAEQLTEEIFIYAYALGDNLVPDTLLTRKARYYTQTDAQGAYQLNYLPFGDYRIIALVDQDYNYVYNMESDLIGIPFTDISLDSLHEVFDGLNLYLIEEDTTGPGIRSVDTLSTREIRLEFTEPVRTVDFSAAVTDSSGDTVAIPAASTVDPQQPEYVGLFFRELPPGEKLTVQATGVRDLKGNPPDSLPLVEDFSSAVQPDTVPPRFLELNPAARTRNVPYDAKISVIFNAPVDTAGFTKQVALVNAEGKEVPGIWHFRNLRAPEFRPDSLLEKTADYSLIIHSDSLQDIFGRAFPDTVITLNFGTENWANLGEISGRVLTGRVGWQQAIIEALPVSGTGEFRKVVRANEPYEIPFLPGGQYRMRVVIDVNQNGEWDKGRTDPWEFSEPFMVKSDTVKVRKRWTTQGIDFNLRFRGTDEGTN